MNRHAWDLHYDPPTLIALRTTPPDNPHIWDEPRFRGARFASDHTLGSGSRRSRSDRRARKIHSAITVDGETYAQPLEIVRDPKSTGDERRFEAAVNLQLRIRDDINTTPTW